MRVSARGVGQQERGRYEAGAKITVECIVRAATYTAASDQHGSCHI